MNDDWNKERKAGMRFGFGSNWENFVKGVDLNRVTLARQSMIEMLRAPGLEGLRFLDAGCGSGIFSLSARQMGADVVSFDFDPHSVKCTESVRKKYLPNDEKWRILQGSILERDFVSSLGQFDIVYSWGVLHHTGRMWDALDNAAQAVKPGGKLYVSIYNDQGFISSYWLGVKRAYNRFPLLKPLIVAFHAPYLYFARTLYRIATGSRIERGMSVWHDMLDWLGGYPFEVARPDQIFGFYRRRGFELLEMKTCGGKHGCNEFVFRRKLQA
jgi:2-polyprenyl-6-hydroxyphenyl methylase/3-demethylubiquinone-9 3-methyltransferase